MFFYKIYFFKTKTIFLGFLKVFYDFFNVFCQKIHKKQRKYRLFLENNEFSYNLKYFSIKNTCVFHYINRFSYKIY